MYLIQLNCTLETYPLAFTPGGTIAGFVNATMVPAVGPGEYIEQVVDVQLGSTAAQCIAGLAALQRYLERAPVEWAKPRGSLVYLEAQVSSTEEVYRSPVLWGWLELGAGGVDQRVNGSMGGKLHLMRANWWERSTEVTIVSGQAITNHRDGGHSNYYYNATYTTTDEALPSQIRVAAALTTSVAYPVKLLVGMRAGSAGVMDGFFEGQDGAARAGVTPSEVSDAASSNGSYYSLAWNGASATRLWHVDLSARLMAQAAGKPFRLLMRLGDSMPTTASEKMWVTWEVMYVDPSSAELVIYETPGGYLTTLSEMVLGPVIHLPPWVVTGTAPALRLCMKAQAAGSGAHALPLDYIDLVPLDGWRYYDPILQAHGISVNDYGQSGVVGPSGGVNTHALEGPGFTSSPLDALQFQFYFWVKEAAEYSASANLAGTVSIYYRPRRRVL